MLKDIDEGRDTNGTLAEKYVLWQTQAAAEMEASLDTLVHDVATIKYSCKHPELSDQEIKDRRAAL